MSIVLATLAALRLMVNAGMNVLTALIDITQINGYFSIVECIVGERAEVGFALVSYYQHILPMLNILLNRIPQNGDSSGQHGQLVDAINQTLQCLERYGGPDAYVNIKYIVPTYQSCIQNI